MSEYLSNLEKAEDYKIIETRLEEYCHDAAASSRLRKREVVIECQAFGYLWERHWIDKGRDISGYYRTTPI